MKKLINLSLSLSSSIGNQGVLMFGNFLLFVLLTKGMPTVLLSQYILFQAITSVVDYARLAFFQNAFINLFHEEGMHHSLVRSTFILFLLSLLLSFVLFASVYLLISWSNVPMAMEMVGYYAISLVGQGLLQFINLMLLAKQQHQKLLWNNLFSQLFNWLSVSAIFFYANNISIWQVILITSSSATLVVIWYIPVLITELRGNRFSMDIAKRLWSFGKFSLGSNTLSLLVSKSDIFIVSAFAGPLQIAIYHIAQKLNIFFEVPLTAITQYYYPRAKKVADNPVSLKYYLNQSVIMQLFIIIPAAIVLFVFAKPILIWITLPAYVDQCVLIVRILLVASIIRPIGRTIGSMFDLHYRSDLNMILLFFNGLVFIALEISLTKPYGIIGLAIANVLSTYLATFIAHRIAKQKFQHSLLSELIKTIKIKFIKKYEIINIKLR
jgi:O-antigen/teichoic acid export membrane protein